MINFLSLGRVKQTTSLSKTTIYRLIGENKFPRPVRLSERRVAWRDADVSEWMIGRVEQ